MNAVLPDKVYLNQFELARFADTVPETVLVSKKSFTDFIVPVILPVVVIVPVTFKFAADRFPVTVKFAADRFPVFKVVGYPFAKKFQESVISFQNNSAFPETAERCTLIVPLPSVDAPKRRIYLSSAVVAGA